MFIQGDLQAVFDALYKMGVIDPVLKMDWKEMQIEMQAAPQKLDQALGAINLCAGNQDALMTTLAKMESHVVNCIALEVARELAESTEKTIVH